ncbi:unnamed protein product [Brachionus calyciflorus]|uniref:protein-tyrosine-phosphatase n=1 Tax=Brachionus calyciflorus TaxID=104777 RepID=A0A813V3L5_9BILA|nr:unnamed protein product [Brachionus calyciflorus]
MSALTSREIRVSSISLSALNYNNYNKKCDDFNSESNNTSKQCNNDFIDAREVKKCILDTPVIFLDCRTAKDFNSVHIKNSIHLNCRDKLIKKRLEAKKMSVVDLINCQETKKKLLESVNVKEAQNYLNSKSLSEMIVIYDDKTSDLDELKDNPLKIVQENIKQFGVKSECKILKGGFKFFFETFPEYCINKCETKIPLDLTLKSQRDQTREEIENCKLTEITPYLYLGNESDAKELDKLVEKGIFYILNVTKNIPFYNQNISENSKLFNLKRISVNDCPNEDLVQYFDEAFNFIDEAKSKNSKVLVHCQAGVSRSPTIVIAYLMKMQNFKAIEAYQKIKEIRPIIAPNIVFMNQLFNFEKKLDMIKAE